ncbi:hypothetical protein GIB67_036250 [Kingdonia uniflora]|uniref:Uncharacterized protein n=1 Tax=Kingdonia uniflora TaxID=39325 RepID=A0A7J7NTF5_9MAGN|nr:hypothetical protein GIB67_036250 [Kingdonia uniflora]
MVEFRLSFLTMDILRGFRAELEEDGRIQITLWFRRKEMIIKLTLVAMAMAMAAKSKLLLRELKTVKTDLAFAKERCAQLEEENRILRESREKGDNPEDNDLSAAVGVVADSIRASGLDLRVANAFRGFGWPEEGVVFALATLPVVEFRGAIPVGYWLQLKPLVLTFLAILGIRENTVFWNSVRRLRVQQCIKNAKAMGESSDEASEEDQVRSEDYVIWNYFAIYNYF